MSPDATPGAERPAVSRVERWLDRINPILVKEVRQTLRSRVVRVAHSVTVVVAMVVGTLALLGHAANGRTDLGDEYFAAVFVLLAIAVLGLVPLAAFLSMSSERDENTHDLLVLSNLRPRQIVLGKLLSALLESALYASAFVPFLVFSFLLRGVNLTALVLVLLGAAMGSLSLIAIALALSSLTRVRALRVFLMAALAMGLAICVIAGSVVAAESIGASRALGAFSWDEWLTLFTCIAVPGALAFPVACARLAHAEENQSTPGRVAVTVCLVVGLAWLAYAYLAWGAGSGDLFEVGAVLLVLLGLCDLFFVTEEDRLGRHVRHDLPRSRAVALLLAPLLPGGGRGFLLLLLHLALVLGVAGALRSTSGARPVEGLSTVAELAVVAAGVVVWIGLPAYAVRHRSERPAVRLVARLVIPVFALVWLLLPALVGFLVQNKDWSQMEHAFNVFWIADQQMDLAWFPVLAALVVVALNVPRALRGVGEVLAASGEARRRCPRPAMGAELAAEASDGVARG